MSCTNDNEELSKLALEITSLGDAIKTLKSEGADGAAIKVKVDLLLQAKRDYAAKNNGIGVDGQPFVEKMTKAQKKAAAAAQKAAQGGEGDAAAAGPGPGPAKPVRTTIQQEQQHQLEFAFLSLHVSHMT